MIAHLIRAVADYWRAQGVHYLAPEQKVSSTSIAQLHDISHEDQKIGEPHRRTQVVEYMTDTIGKTLTARQAKV